VRLLVCSMTDHSALWVYERLRARGRRPAAVVLSEHLADSRVLWDHRIGQAGRSVRLRLADGHELSSAAVDSVLNRLYVAPLSAIGAADPVDRLYATNELTAFAASWVRALAPVVINEPTPQGLAGRWRYPLEWRLLARRAGLRTADAHVSCNRPLPPESSQGSCTVLAVDGRLLASRATPTLQRAVARFTALAGLRVAGLRFEGLDPVAGGWTLLDATPHPDLTLAGEAGVKAIEEALAR
jgi:hypothetical protein